MTTQDETSASKTSASSLTPEGGVRVRLDLEGQDADGARYKVTLFFREREVVFEASVPEAGSLEVPQEDAPAYALRAAQAFLRQTQGTRRTSGRWPRRVLRWRPEK